MGVYEEVKQALQDIVAPELRSLQAEIKRLDEKIDSQKSELLSEIKRLDGKVDSLKSEVTTEIRRLDEKICAEMRHLDEKIDIAIHIRERLAFLEAKVATITK